MPRNNIPASTDLPCIVLPLPACILYVIILQYYTSPLYGWQLSISAATDCYSPHRGLGTNQRGLQTPEHVSSEYVIVGLTDKISFLPADGTAA